MGSRNGTLIAGFAGLLWPILSVTRLVATNEVEAPIRGASPTDIAAFFEGASFDTVFMVGVAMVAVAYSLFVVFIAKVADLVGASEPGARWVGYLILAGAAIDVVLALSYVGIYATAVYLVSTAVIPADASVALYGLAYGMYWVELITISLWLAPLGIAIVATGLFPRWLGALMVVNAGASIVAFFLPPEIWNIVGGLPYLWILIAAALVLVRADRYSETDRAAPDDARARAIRPQEAG